ncbi:MAG: molybdopterin-dependent oxidoreductase [Eggerthellaceae bacterium]|nr:molybdopterin-dependent oxidoreductase [Eggerthellaceae bacterium]
MGLSLTACVPSTTQQEGDEAAVPVSRLDEIQSRPVTYPAEGGMAELKEKLGNKAEEYAPEIRTLDDGTQIQRTPISNFNLDGLDDVDSTYNIYTLNADDRGCDSCHTEGLGDVVAKLEYPHWPVDNGLHTNITVEDCMYCHDESQSRDGHVPFSQLIHGIHSKQSFTDAGGNCMSCHAPASDTREGLSLWDAVKHRELRGINKVKDVQGDFSFDQTTLLGDDSVFRVDPGSDERWGAQSQMFINEAYDNKPGSQEDFDNWEITVSGLVNNPYTITLGELIKEAPVEEFIAKLNCVLTTPNGTQLGNYAVKGIPIEYLIERGGGAKEGATGARAIRGDNPAGGQRISLDTIAEDGGWLVFEVNGRPLTMAEGWPVRAWYPQYAAYISARYCSGIEVTEEHIDITLGGLPYGSRDARGDEYGWRRMYMHEDFTTGYDDKPVVAVTYTPEGKIIPVGKPYEFQGYADAWEDPIVAMEFSMDGGETWTHFDTPDTDPIAWVYWHFTFTPEEPGAYVLKVRGITEGGLYSTYGDEVMVNAQ